MGSTSSPGAVVGAPRLQPAGPPDGDRPAAARGDGSPAQPPAAARLRRWRRAERQTVPTPAATTTSASFDIAPNDPILRYLQDSSGVVDITPLTLESPALTAMRTAGVTLVVPLVASGELLGLLTLGPRRSERGYSTDDRQLLSALAAHAAPAMRVGQLVREQEAAAATRERIEQELVVARLIQQQFLPDSLPDLPGWQVAAFYRPARSVGGDFYDFIELPDGRAMLVVGDVTDKGVPAALVMASTHALLRSAAPELLSPAKTLAAVNALLHDDIPAHMFVTCIALVIDPHTGDVEFANAGHDLPYLRTSGEGGYQVGELRARGMPLGLMPGMTYEEKSIRLLPGDHLLLHSDGLAEAHDPGGQMFGFPRVAALAGRPVDGQSMIDLCLSELAAFTGPDAEQEDDITLVTLQCVSGGETEPGR